MVAPVEAALAIADNEANCDRAIAPTTASNTRFAIDDAVRIKRSNGAWCDVRLTQIQHESRYVTVTWCEAGNSYTKDIPFAEMIAWNRPKKFSLSKVDTQSPVESPTAPKECKVDTLAAAAQGDKENAPVEKKIAAVDQLASRKKNIGSPLVKRPCSAMGKVAPVSKPNPTEAKTAAKRKRHLSSSTTDLEVFEEKALSFTKKKPTIKKSRTSGQLAQPRMSIAKRQSMLPVKTGALKPVNSARAPAKPFAGKQATLRAAAVAEFVSLIADERAVALKDAPNRFVHAPRESRDKITVALRKRPLNASELAKGAAGALEIVSVVDCDRVVLHEPKERVDLSRHIENSEFRYDYVFDDQEDNESIYHHLVQPLIPTVLARGNASCFVYGQTGSGKTYTIYGDAMRTSSTEPESDSATRGENATEGVRGLCHYLLHEIIECVNEHYGAGKVRIYVGLFEIYNSKVYDLLNERANVRMLEDSRGKIQIRGLTELEIAAPDDALRMLMAGAACRSTGKTSCNENSSRSHAILQIQLKEAHADMTRARVLGKFSMIDLAGNERGADNINMAAATRQESSEINRNLLSLKECIRALDKAADHVPFRDCLLTKILKDSFVGANSQTCMISHISPSFNSYEHTLNTLRYTSMLKHLPVKKPQPNTVAPAQQTLKTADVPPPKTEKTPDLPLADRKAPVQSEKLKEPPCAIESTTCDDRRTLAQLKGSVNSFLSELTETTDFFAKQTLDEIDCEAKLAQEVKMFVADSRTILQSMERKFCKPTAEKQRESR